MPVKVLHDDEGNKIIQIYDNDGNITSEQITRIVPDSIVPIEEQEPKIISIGNSKFYLTNYKSDLVQECILNSNQYFGYSELKAMSKYLNPNSIVIDIGANIGNHTLYFANECKVKKVYSFEPVPYTYKILEKNIEINNLQDRVETFCIGFADTCTNGSIKTYDLKNLGGTRLMHDEKGKIKLATLDSLDFREKIDFIKIDVETMDYEVICGAKETIKKYKPVIEIESFDNDREKTDPLLRDLGYKVAKEFKNCCEYIYVPCQ